MTRSAFLCVLCACSATERGPDTAAAFAHLEEGRELARKGDLTGAIALYTKALRANPDLAEAWHERGVVNVRLRLSHKAEGEARVFEDRALGDFSEALRKNPAYADAFFNRAMIHSSRARYKLAVDDLLNASRCKPGDPEPHLWLGEIYEGKFEDRIELAMNHYEKYVDLGGRQPEAREKVRVWKEFKNQAAAPPLSKATSARDEELARELHEEFKRLFAEVKKAEALQAVERLLSRYGHTKYVQERSREFTALHDALKK
jgi:tetratricopeptide (TPR) repeat protein